MDLPACDSSVWMSPILGIGKHTRVEVGKLETTVRELLPPDFRTFDCMVFSNLFESDEDFVAEEPFPFAVEAL